MRRIVIGITLLSLALIVSPVYAAGITVNTPNDNATSGDGWCTLREAIINANNNNQSGSTDCAAGSGADVITFAGNYTITLVGSQLPAITSDVTITGNGPENTIVQADINAETATYRVFEVGAAGSLKLNDLTLRNGHCNGSCVTSDKGGGGIYNAGTLVLTRSVLASNVATGNGGAIYSQAGAVTIQDSSTIGGIHAGLGNMAYDGGGVYVAGGTLTASDGSFAMNNADNNGAGINVNTGAGAVLDSSATTTLGMNWAKNRGGLIYNAGMVTLNGGRLKLNAGTFAGGAIYNTGTLTVAGIAADGNMSSSGGAVFNAGTLSIQNSTIGTANTAMYGGGIYNDVSATLTVDSTAVTTNEANNQGSGGNIYNKGTLNILNGSTINGGTAYLGAGIYSDGGAILLSGSTIVNNTSDNDGGGVYMKPGATMVVDASTISANTAADIGRGGGIFYMGSSLTIQNGSVIGGASTGNIRDGIVSYGTTGSIIVDHSTISANTGYGVKGMGILTIRNGSVIGGAGAGNTNTGVVGSGSESVVTIDASTVSANGGGGVSSSTRLYIQNHSLIGGAGAGNTNYSGVSAAGVSIIDASTVSGNTAGGVGNGGTMTIRNGSLIGGPGAGNSNYHGGGITNSGTLTIDASTVSANTASGTEGIAPIDMGGGIYNSGMLTIQNGSVIGGPGAGNTAVKDGGGIFNYTGTVVIDHSTVSDNSAVNGAGIRTGLTTYSVGALTIRNGALLARNTASGSGGGIFISYLVSDMKLTDSFLIANSASDTGSAVYFDKDTFGIHTGIFATGNCIINNNGTAFYATLGVPEKATGNWWGSPSGAGSTGADTANANWNTSGWLTSAPLSCNGGAFNLSATGASQTTINLKWTDAATDETGFQVQRSEDGLAWADLVTTPANATTDADTSLTCNTKRLYRVRALSASGSTDWTQTASATTSACPPAIDLPNAAHNFGSLRTGQTSAPFAFTVHNTGVGPLTITGLVVAGEFATDLGTCSAQVQPGDTCDFSVTFHPITPGPQIGSVTIQSNTPGTPPQVSLNGTATAPLVQLTPDTHDLGSVLPGQASVPFEFTIHNTGNDPLTVTGLDVIGEFAADIGTCSAEVPAPGSCEFSVTFHPTTPGSKSGSVTIQSNAPGSAPVVTLSGYGLNSLPAPVLKSPKNGSSTLRLPVKFTWKSLKGVSGYHIRISQDSTFQTGVIEGDATKPKFQTSLPAFGVYYWEVASKDAAGAVGGYSAPFSFTYTLNKAPKAGSTVKSVTPKFAWQAVRGATYLLEFSTDPAFPAGPGTVRVTTSKASYPVPKTAPLSHGVTYYWRLSTNGGSTWTPVWSFTVK